MIAIKEFENITDDDKNASVYKTLVDNKCNELIMYIDELTDTDAEFHEAFTKEVFRHFGWSYFNKVKK
jgi:hypothetical protein